MRVSSYFKPMKISGSGVANLGTGIYKGQVQKVIYPDEADSVSKIYLEYDVLVEMGSGVSLFKGVPALSALGGSNDYSEMVFEPAEAASTGKNEMSNTFQNRNGSIVAIAFWNNNFQRPVIIGAYTHPKKARRSKADGISYIQVFRGLKTEINKDGEWSITYQSPYGPDGKLKAEATGPSFIKLNKKGGMEISLKKGTIKQTHDVDAEKTTFEYKSGLKIEFDGKSDTVTQKTKGGATVKLDGSDTIDLKVGSAEIKIDGASGKINLKAGGTEINIDSAMGKIELKGDLVDVGSSASALAALGPQLLAWLSTHTHPFIDITPIPIQSMTFPPAVPPPPTLLSTSVKIKS